MYKQLWPILSYLVDHVSIVDENVAEKVVRLTKHTWRCTFKSFDVQFLTEVLKKFIECYKQKPISSFIYATGSVCVCIYPKKSLRLSSTSTRSTGRYYWRHSKWYATWHSCIYRNWNPSKPTQISLKTSLVFCNGTASTLLNCCCNQNRLIPSWSWPISVSECNITTQPNQSTGGWRFSPSSWAATMNPSLRPHSLPLCWIVFFVV